MKKVTGGGEGEICSVFMKKTLEREREREREKPTYKCINDSSLHMSQLHAILR